MALSKVNFNSLNVTPSASKFLAWDGDADALAAADIGGALTLISTQTASDDSNISITSGIDSTYKEYIIKLINVHPATDSDELQINFSVDGGSNYNVTKTSSGFIAQHAEDDSYANFFYDGGTDSAQLTGDQTIHENVGNANDESCCSTIHLYDPSNTTFVKHFLITTAAANGASDSTVTRVGGYCNTTSAVDAVKFDFIGANIQSGVIKLYGVS